MREVAYRFQILRDGVPCAEMAAAGAPSLRFQSASTIMRSLSGAFLPPDAEVNWFRDRIRAQMRLNGAWHNLGLFVVSSVSESYDNGASVWNIQAMDRALLLKQVKTEGLLHLAAGTPYLSAISALLTEAGISSVLADDSGETLATDREDWNEGTSLIDIINALLGEIAYDPLWFDADGVARLTRYAEPSVERIAHTYRSGEGSLIAAGCTLSRDIYNPVNVFKAKVENADLPGPLVAVAVNDSVTSPISTVSLGRRILAPVVKLDNIASQAALQDYVEKLRAESQLAEENITYVTANLPGHGYHDVVALEHERLSGVYQETGWTMSLAYNGQMTHQAKRILYL